MDRRDLFGDDWSSVVDGVADDVHDTAETLRTDRDSDREASVDDFLASDETVGRVESDSADLGVAEMLCDFEDKSVFDASDFESVQDRWEFAFELDVDDGTDDLRDHSL